MSLTITSRIQTVEGFTLENAYARVAVADQIKGDRLQASLSIFASEEAFLQGAEQVNALVDGSSVTPYDREMGTDILDLAHDRLIDKLAGQNILATKNL